MSGNQVWIIDASSGSPSYVSQDIRQLLSVYAANGTSRVLGGRSGYLPGRQPTTLSIGGSSPNFTYSISAFAAIIDPAFSATQGPYPVKTDGANTGNITAPNGSNPRKDVIYAQVQDTAIDGSTFRRLLVSIQTGTPGATPAEPSPPTGAMTLAVITVPVLGGGTPTVVVKNQFTAAAGGVVMVDTLANLLAGTAITNPVESMVAWPMDANEPYYYDGAAWRRHGVQPLVWNHIGDIGSIYGSGAADLDPTEATYYRPAFTKDALGFVTCRGTVQVTGAQAANWAFINLPAGYRTSKVHRFYVANSGTTGMTVRVNANGDFAIDAAQTSNFLSIDGIRFYADA